MHPALERLVKLEDDTETIEALLNETGWLAGNEAQQLMSQANALPALIAALVEIEKLCDDQTNYFPSASHNGALRYVQSIIQKHLEPLK